MKRVILFGGTFDPPHIGHLTMAQLAYEQADCEQVWLLPAVAPPHKSDHRVTPYQIRRTMVANLISEYSGLRICDVEEERPEPSFSVDTVRILQQRHPDVEFRWLIGSDSLHDLPMWHGSMELASRIGFIVAARPNWPHDVTLQAVLRQLPALQVEWLEMPVLDISSTYLRRRWLAGQPLCGLVPEAVRTVWEAYQEKNCIRVMGEKNGD